MDKARDCPDCPECGAPVGTPIREAEIERWDGPDDATLFCPSCGAGWVGSPEDLARARASWAAYELEMAGQEQRKTVRGRRQQCGEAGCRRAAHYSGACCVHRQLSLPLQLALIEEVGTACCPIRDCGAPAVRAGLCADHAQAADRLGFGPGQLTDKQMRAIFEEHSAHLLEVANKLFDEEQAAKKLPGVGRCDYSNGSAFCTKAAGHKGKHTAKPEAPKPASPEDRALDELEKKLATAEAEVKRAQQAEAKKKAKPCGEKAAKGNAQGCIHPKGHDGLHSDTTRTWRTRKPAPKPSDPSFPVCAVSNCARPARAGHLCATHYRKARSLGIPTSGTYTLEQVDLLSGRKTSTKEKRR